MNSLQKILFPVIVAAQLAVLGFMITKQELLLAHGTKVLLKCEPIDPRSLFSGDYVILNYEISDIRKEIVSASGIGDPHRLKNSEIFVALEPQSGNRYYHAVAVSENIDRLKKENRVIIRGRVQYAGNTLRIKYGVESYFVPQREGKTIENKMEEVSVEVSVSGNGDSAISRLFIEDMEVKFY